MSNGESVVRQFWRALVMRLVLRRTVALLTLWALLWGTAVLVLRAGFGVAREPLLWGLLAFPILILFAFFWAKRSFPSTASVRALLDQHGGHGGLLMAGAERPLGGWNETLGAPPPPRVHWRGGRAWTLFSLALAFLLLAVFLPPRFIGQAAEPRLDLDREIGRLSQQVEVLEQLGLVDRSRAEALKQSLEKLKGQASVSSPGRSLEAMDRVKEGARETARAAAEKAARQAENLARTETLAEALREAGPALDDKQRQAAQERLAEELRKGGDMGDRLQGKLDPKLLETARKGASLRPEDLKRLAEAASRSKQAIAAEMQRLHQAGLIDREALAAAEKTGKGNAKELAEALREGKGKAKLEEILARAETGGGPDKEKGTAGRTALSWGKETTQQGVKFKEIALPPPAVEARKAALKRGPGRGSPDPVLPAELGPDDPIRRGALEDANAGSGSANTLMLLPRHRAAVQRYFERETK